MKATKASIEQFLAAGKIAIAGVSRNPKEFGYQVFKQIQHQGKDIYIVHPEADQIAGYACYTSVKDLPATVGHLVVLTPKKSTTQVVSDAVAKGIKNIWIQQFSDTPEAVSVAKAAGVQLITGECIFLHTAPVKGIHKFHRAIRTFFGKMPR